MPDLAMELRHLAQADRHILEGERRLLALEGAIARAAVLRMNTDEANVTLGLVADGLTVCKAHRLMILQAIEDIDRR